MKFVKWSYHIRPLELVKVVKCLDILEIKFYEKSDD